MSWTSGAGRGPLTRLLGDRWSDATLLGVDSSAEMIDSAQAHAIEGRLSFEIGDIVIARSGAGEF